MQKIVTIGGGTGHYQILRGLKNRDCYLTAIVNVCDNGGHSGELRDEFGVLPPGDSRQCLVALANEESSNILRRLFEHRIEGENGKRILSIGNIFIAGLEDLTRSPSTALKEAGKILGIRGRVIPVTEDRFNINARLENGQELRGQKEVSYTDSASKIVEVYAAPIPHVHIEAAEALREADKIIICPGDLYGSIIPNFLVEGVTDAIKVSGAKVVYVCNIVTKQGNYGFKASDFLREIERYLKRSLDKIIVNTKIPSQETQKKYLGEKSGIVENDLQQDARVVRAELVEEYPSERKTLLRHDPIRTAREIMDV
jgi:uncharacterized cofD-like protein